MFKNPLCLFIHEPARLFLMLNIESVKEADFTFLLKITGLSKGNLSVQMGKLRDKDLVTINKMIRENKSYTVYSITKLGKKTLQKYKQEMKSFLT